MCLGRQYTVLDIIVRYLAFRYMVLLPAYEVFLDNFGKKAGRMRQRRLDLLEFHLASEFYGVSGTYQQLAPGSEVTLVLLLAGTFSRCDLWLLTGAIKSKCHGFPTFLLGRICSEALERHQSRT